MTNKELINILQSMPLDAEIYIRDIDYIRIPLTEDDIYLVSTRNLFNSEVEKTITFEKRLL